MTRMLRCLEHRRGKQPCASCKGSRRVATILRAHPLDESYLHVNREHVFGRRDSPHVGLPDPPGDWHSSQDIVPGQ